MFRSASKIMVAAGVALALGCSPAMASAAPAPAESVAVSQPSTGSAAVDLTRILLRCLMTGSSVAPGDPMGFPVLCV
ncbi:hypothetical protein [Nocardia otitidiscaviarum]|uniref:hypothetical protein n=1 Tax=Nocardia otitidiscaviarum TaxID=1823 RepID=UPI001895A041|nr:hypothetical protein [Nocardia otitidiscaviarum]MBF6241277.1 hypothetical protein [Nocardia otitidiscaviarum]